MLTWVAVYDGNDTLSQYNEDGSENKYGDIDRERLDRFILLEENGEVRIVLNLDASKKLIFRRRTAINLKNERHEVVFIAGFQSDKGQTILFYFESTGHIELTDGFKEGHQWFYPVNFLPEEEIKE